MQKQILHSACLLRHARQVQNDTMSKEYSFYVYILTNKNKIVLYTGVTNNLKRRLCEHQTHKNHINAFTHKYNCYYLVYYEEHNDIKQAITREKEIKGWMRYKKDAIITNFNPEWRFLNEDVSS
jgi:putative endonuclease